LVLLSCTRVRTTCVYRGGAWAALTGRRGSHQVASNHASTSTGSFRRKTYLGSLGLGGDAGSGEDLITLAALEDRLGEGQLGLGLLGLLGGGSLGGGSGLGGGGSLGGSSSSLGGGSGLRGSSSSL
jgi:hypothetical protein